MPELPEVETVARQLAPRLRGRRVTRLEILDDRLRTGPTPRVAGRTVLEVVRDGKRVLIGFSSPARGGGALWLAVHLRMTGRLLYLEPGSAIEQRPRARFRLDRGQLHFADTRRFGTFDWAVDRDALRTEAVDPMSGAFTVRRLGELLGNSAQPMKAWLLRQDRLVGLGNIYASEILHTARIAPTREARSLDAAERRRLHRSVRQVLTRAIEACGTTFSDFQDARGVEGEFQNCLAVYGREGEPCERCGKPVRRVVQQQRSTFFCPGCQR